MLRLRETLPDDFRAGDVLAFHRRDATEVAERVRDGRIEKGMLWQGQPALLEIRFEAGEVLACLDCDPSGASMQDVFAAMIRRMLGLDQDVAGFEARHGGHPVLGAVISRQRGLRVPAAATPFEALSWAVTGQQISLAAAVSVRRRLIEAVGVRHRSGLHCYPDAASLLGLSVGTLREAGLSQAKAGTLKGVAQRVVGGDLPLNDWCTRLPEDAAQRLQALPGIGPWTTDYTLLRGFGWLDGSLHGDAALRRALQALLGVEERPDQAGAQRWLADFSPWRALVGAHLWATLSAPPG